MTDDELYLYVKNDGQIYRDQTTPLLGWLADRKADGTYQRGDATSRFLVIVNDAANKYRREFPGTVFSAGQRRSTAAALAADFEREWALGNMEWARGKTGPGLDRAKKSNAQLKREIDQALRGSPRRR